MIIMLYYEWFLDEDQIKVPHERNDYPSHYGMYGGTMIAIFAVKLFC